MSAVRNVLFVMCDQLRADYLACYGHQVIETPNIDALAARGVRFTRAYVQAGVCGPSRMSSYTGRYPSTHGATWNFMPLPLGEMTLGDHLRIAGRALHLAGKTHFAPDRDGMAARGIAPESAIGALLSEGGFAIVTRHEGLPNGKADYDAYLSGLGYAGADPWLDYAVGGVDEAGHVVSGWRMRNVHLPARVKAEHSETAYVTNRALEFIAECGDRPWALHLSYIKPHWPYIAPAPYHARYRKADTGPIRKSPAEREGEHPVVRAYRDHDECRVFARDEAVRHVRPAYMGLIREIDEHIGRLMEALDRAGRLGDTLIVFSSDHGDFLGDHGLGEKELFYEEIQRVPFILYDPDREADTTRGGAEDRFVEASVDVVPTILDALGLERAEHWIEGRSLLALTRGAASAEWRDCVFSELDYSTRPARRALGLPSSAPCRAWMVRTERWKFVHWQGFRPQLFDLAADPDEFHDLGADPGHEAVRRELGARLLDWFGRLKRRTTVTHAAVDRMTDGPPPGIHIGQW